MAVMFTESDRRWQWCLPRVSRHSYSYGYIRIYIYIYVLILCRYCSNVLYW